MNFRFVTHVDIFSVLAKFHHLVSGDQWAGQTPLAQMTLLEVPHKTLYLRVQENPTRENWFDDLPMHDEPEYEKWKSLRSVLARCRKAIFADPMLGPMIDQLAAPGRIVISVLQPRSTMNWHSDIGEYAARHIRFHLALTTNPLCMLYCGGEQYHLHVGTLAHINVLEQHSAVNFGISPRSHVVFELRRKAVSDAGT